MNLEEANIFLKEVREIYVKIPKKEKTYMEICGYPHYEIVCSNILAFYFNPKEEHKLGEIFLKSLIDVIEEKNLNFDRNIDFSNMNIFREYITDKGNWIDIVLQNNDIAIGIENKIMAGVNNDLTDYANTLKKLNDNVVKIILSVHDESKVAEENDYINITYAEFFNKLRLNLCNYTDNHNKWYIYLIDFMKNIEGFEVEKEMEENIYEWMKDHQEDINSFYELLNTTKMSFNKRINEFGTKFEERIDCEYRVKFWADSDVQLGAYITIGKLGCNLDVCLTLDGWKIGLNIWKRTSQTKIKHELIKNKYTIVEEINNHVYLYNLDYSCDIDDVVDKTKEIYDLVNNII